MGDDTDRIFRGKHSLPSSAYERYETFDDEGPVQPGPMPPPPAPLWSQEDVAPTVWAQAQSEPASTSRFHHLSHTQASSSRSVLHTNTQPHRSSQLQPHQSQHPSKVHPLPQPDWSSTTAPPTFSATNPPQNVHDAHVPNAQPQLHAQPYQPVSTSYPSTGSAPSQPEQYERPSHPSADVAHPPASQPYPSQPPSSRLPPPPSPVNLPVDQETLDFFADQALGAGDDTDIDDLDWLADLKHGGDEGSWDQYAEYDASADQIQYYAVDEDSSDEEDGEPERDPNTQVQLEGSGLIDAQGRAVVSAYDQAQGPNFTNYLSGAGAVPDAGQVQGSYSGSGTYYPPAPAWTSPTDHEAYTTMSQEQDSVQMHLSDVPRSEDYGVMYASALRPNQYANTSESSFGSAYAHAPPESTNAHTSVGHYGVISQHQHAPQLDTQTDWGQVHSYQSSTAIPQAPISDGGGSHPVPQHQQHHYESAEPTMRAGPAQTYPSIPPTSAQLPVPRTVNAPPYQQNCQPGQYSSTESNLTAAQAQMYHSTASTAQGPADSTGAAYDARYQQQHYAYTNQDTNPSQVPGYDPVSAPAYEGGTTFYEAQLPQQQYLEQAQYAYPSQDYHAQAVPVQNYQSAPGGDFSQVAAQYPSTSYSPYPVGVPVASGVNPVEYDQTAVGTSHSQGAQQGPGAGYKYVAVPPQVEQTGFPASSEVSTNWNSAWQGGYVA